MIFDIFDFQNYKKYLKNEVMQKGNPDSKSAHFFTLGKNIEPEITQNLNVGKKQNFFDLDGSTYSSPI